MLTCPMPSNEELCSSRGLSTLFHSGRMRSCQTQSWCLLVRAMRLSSDSSYGSRGAACIRAFWTTWLTILRLVRCLTFLIAPLPRVELHLPVCVEPALQTSRASIVCNSIPKACALHMLVYGSSVPRPVLHNRSLQISEHSVFTYPVRTSYSGERPDQSLNHTPVMLAFCGSPRIDFPPPWAARPGAEIR